MEGRPHKVGAIGRRWVAVGPAAAMAILSAACGNGPSEAPRQLSFGHVGAPGSLFALSAEEFAKRLDRELLAVLNDRSIAVNWANQTYFEGVSQAVHDEFGAEVASGRELIDEALMLAGR